MASAVLQTDDISSVDKTAEVIIFSYNTIHPTCLRSPKRECYAVLKLKSLLSSSK